MFTIKTNPEMDAKIVGILRTAEMKACHYAAQRIEELEAAFGQWQRHFHVPSPVVTQIPCVRCQGPVIEFEIPSEIWNLVVQHGGREGSGEYLCYDCFLLAAGEKVERLEAIVAWLATTADGVPIVHEGPCYTPDGRLAYIEPFSTTPIAIIKHDLPRDDESFDARTCYSTMEAQKAADAAKLTLPATEVFYQCAMERSAEIKAADAAEGRDDG